MSKVLRVLLIVGILRYSGSYIVLVEGALADIPCELNVLSFFPCTDPTIEDADCDLFLYPAALLAVEDINTQRYGPILTGANHNCSVQLVALETKNEVEQTWYTFADYIGTASGSLHGVIGPDSSLVAEQISYAVAQLDRVMNSTQIQITYGATDISLLNRERYPHVFRTIPTEKLVNIGRLRLLMLLGWYRVGVMSAAEDVYSRTAEDLLQLASKALPRFNLTFLGSFERNTDSILTEIHTSHLKIVLGIFSEEHARRVLCNAHKFIFGSLTDASYIWILPSYYNPNWWLLSNDSGEQCSNTVMREILKSVIFVGSFNHRLAGNTSPFLPSSQEFYDRLLEKISEVFPTSQFSSKSNKPDLLLSSHAANVYDAVLALGVMWNHTLSQINSSTLDEIELLAFALTNLAFHGLSGNKAFDEVNSSAQILVSQFSDNAQKPIGVFRVSAQENLTATSEFINLSNESTLTQLPFLRNTDIFRWKGTGIPTDGVLTEYSAITIFELAIVGVLVFALVSCSVGLLVINWAWRQNRHIKASSPMLNIIVIVSFTIIMPSAVTVGLSFSTVPYDISKKTADAYCNIDLFIRNVAYVAGITTILAKNWRIYRIFHNTRLQKEAKGLSTPYLLLMVLCVLAPFTLLIAAWVTFNPLLINYGLIRIGVSRNVQVSYCAGPNLNTWQSLCIAYTGVILIAVVFFSAQNNKANTLFVSEGKGATRVVMLNIVLFIVFVIGIAFVEKNLKLYRLTYWLNVCWLLFLPAMLLAVIFVPKFISIFEDYRKRQVLNKEEHKTRLMLRRLSSANFEAQLLKTDLEKKEERIKILRTNASTRQVS